MSSQIPYPWLSKLFIGQWKKTYFDPEDAILDMEALLKVSKINNHDKAREYACHWWSQEAYQEPATKSLRDLLVALVSDPVKS